MMPQGRRLFWLLSTAFLLLLLASLDRLPPVVASHFDESGLPNGWASRPVYALLLLGIGGLLPLGTIGLVAALTRRGPELLNLPSPEYWRRPEHGSEAVRRARGYMWWLGCIMTATALAVHGLILQAHTSRPPRLHNGGTLVVIGAALLGIGLWTVGWYRLFRPPADGSRRVFYSSGSE